MLETKINSAKNGAMKYYGDKSVDEDDFQKFFHFPLPENTKKLLLKADYINGQLNSGKDAINLSLEKWRAIAKIYDFLKEKQAPEKYYKEIYEQIGYKTCALCITSIEEYTKTKGEIKFKTDKCSVCALAKIDACPDDNSAYKKIEQILNIQNDRINNAEATKLFADDFVQLGQSIEKMIANLESL